MRRLCKIKMPFMFVLVPQCVECGTEYKRSIAPGTVSYFRQCDCDTTKEIVDHSQQFNRLTFSSNIDDLREDALYFGVDHEEFESYIKEHYPELATEKDSAG